MVLCTGSIAYDYILTFKGRFKDHILLDKTHILNLSFLVDDLQKRRGGVAGNYAYNLALLGCPAAVLATAGSDAAEYRDWLMAKGVDCSGLRLLEGEMSATGFTTTDMDDNQLTGYYGGAMWRAAMLGLDDGPPHVDAVIIGPNDPGAMKRLVVECRERRVPFVFDPAHQLPMMDSSDVTDSTTGAWIVIGNDYELELIQERTRRDTKGLLDLADIVVTTLGRHGSRITTRDHSVDVPSAPALREADPTGAGDAYRAGLVAGLMRGLDLGEAGRIASLAATYAVEHVGTIEHAYTRAEFCVRHREAFGFEVSEKLWTS
ncbi:MAG: carbohydrate kinase family protein [Chloroflexi bacterium]|nr:MAG: carbohydrate kinase family protein [Chloroflexota bacterium]TMF38519.1 MAG: carbohydrate kinase family protein [Chloroflexota bacterium]